MLKGIEAEAHEAGYDLLVHATQQVEAIRRRLGEQNTDGLLIFTNSLAPAELQRLHNINFPVVLLHQTPPETLDIPTITIENKDGAAMLVNHLIETHGRRRIVYLRGPEGHEDSVWRERGYREALESHHIAFNPALVASGGFDDDEALAAVQRLLSDGPDFDAIFAGDDDAAFGAIRALRLGGRIVPQDVSVVGFDDIPFARYLSPALTTVRAPIEQVGREAVRQLVRQLNGEQADPLTLMRTELVIRESCGCIPSTKDSDEPRSSTRR
jgi:DNA-binding LacI/PurR family transcriptional regulator